jgi:CRP/FNR family transcriptional regulator, cyclic AMP receptor protein
VEWALLGQLDEVLSATRRRRYRRGETVFHEGDPGDTMHLVEKGFVAVRVTTPLGEVATLRVIGPGQWFGEMALIDRGPRSASLCALVETETRSLHFDDFVALRERDPSVVDILLVALSHEVRRLSAAVADAMYLPVSTRVPRTLLAMRERFAAEVIPLTQDDLAGLCGTTRQSVNQALSALQDRGAIAVARGRVTVIDVALLERAAR